jgi:uncharacterized membrane protein
LSFTVAGLALLFLFAWGVLVLINRSDAVIVERRNNYRLADSTPITAAAEFTEEEQRTAKHFIADTLPVLMQRGLIKKYERRETGTIVLVAGGMWKKRSLFFKERFLAEILTHNKVNGYEVRTQVVDSRSGKVYARISPMAKIEFYD